jgi:hypothetical protein
MDPAIHNSFKPTLLRGSAQVQASGRSCSTALASIGLVVLGAADRAAGVFAANISRFRRLSSGVRRHQEELAMKRALRMTALMLAFSAVAQEQPRHEGYAPLDALLQEFVAFVPEYQEGRPCT